MHVDSDILLYHNLLDCGMRKLTVGRSIAWDFLSRSLFSRLIATTAHPILWEITHVVMVNKPSITMCEDMHLNDNSRCLASSILPN